ncbi:MJ0144 family RNA dihydrouridine synthase-like protein [Methanocaldococcus infernus]
MGCKVVLAPMAGITDGDFCKKYRGLFYIYTIGGYNLDKATYLASKRIEERGRKEFSIPLKDFDSYIVNEINKIDFGLVSVNVRFLNIDEALPRLKIISEHADIIELNCHCRQREITELGIGQELLRNVKLLSSFLEKLYSLDKPLFLKIRLNYIETEELIKNLSLVREYFDGLHVDCFYPGKDHPDIEGLKRIRESFEDKTIIGNNSITSLERAKEMLKYSNLISVARAVLKNKIDWIYKL